MPPCLPPCYIPYMCYRRTGYLKIKWFLYDLFFENNNSWIIHLKMQMPFPFELKQLIAVTVSLNLIFKIMGQVIINFPPFAQRHVFCFFLAKFLKQSCQESAIRLILPIVIAMFGWMVLPFVIVIVTKICYAVANCVCKRSINIENVCLQSTGRLLL